MGVEVTLGFEYFKVTHHMVPSYGWRTGANIELKINVDALKAGVDLIAAVLQVEDLLATAATSLATDLAGTPLAMIGEASDAYALNHGDLQLDCIYWIPFNLWAIIVDASLAGEVIPYIDIATSAVLVVHEALDVTLSDIGFGPSIGVDVPVLLQIEDVTIDNVKFTTTEICSQWVLSSMRSST